MLDPDGPERNNCIRLAFQYKRCSLPLAKMVGYAFLRVRKLE